MSEELSSSTMQSIRTAQRDWQAVPLKQRLMILYPLRTALAATPDRFLESICLPHRHTTADTLGAELLPFADACRFLERRAKTLLRPRSLGMSGRPLWLWGTRAVIHRDPHGVVLIIGPWNYPLLLTGVQAVQALVAGNAVLLKPGQNSSAVMQVLKEVLVSAGLNPGLLTILPEAPQAAQQAIRLGVDYAVLTGSAVTGQNVLHQLSDTLIPAAMELSGCDALFVLPDADLVQAAKALSFGLRFNSSATCIAPRRVFVPIAELAKLEKLLHQEMESLPKLYVPNEVAEKAIQLVREAISQGATLLIGSFDNETGQSEFPLILSNVTPGMELAQADLFAPVASLLSYHNLEEALQANLACPYALSASVFGPTLASERFAKCVEAGSVVINDLIAPTADPRLGFGGRRQSGFGLTRGAEGLLSMTVQKSVITRRGGWRLHFRRSSPKIERNLRGYLKLVHGGRLGNRIQGLWELVRGVFSK